MVGNPIPVFGWTQYPRVGFVFAQNPAMDICRAIAQNLAGWMAETNTLGTLEDVSRASGVSFGTVQRIEQAYLRECAGHR